jgi:hypothetical protein
MVIRPAELDSGERFLLAALTILVERGVTGLTCGRRRGAGSSTIGVYTRFGGLSGHSCPQDALLAALTVIDRDSGRHGTARRMPHSCRQSTGAKPHKPRVAIMSCEGDVHGG